MLSPTPVMKKEKKTQKYNRMTNTQPPKTKPGDVDEKNPLYQRNIIREMLENKEKIKMLLNIYIG